MISFIKSALDLLFGSKAKRQREKLVAELTTLTQAHIPFEIENPLVCKGRVVYIADLSLKSHRMTIVTARSEDTLKEILETQIVTLATMPNSLNNIRCDMKVIAKDQYSANKLILDLPKSLRNIDRRHSFRVVVMPSWDVQLFTNDKEPYIKHGKIIDISYKGMRIAFSGDYRDTLKQYQTMQFINEELHIDEKSSGYFQIVRVEYQEKNDTTTVGGIFLMLDGPHLSRLGHLITKIQIAQKQHQE